MTKLQQLTKAIQKAVPEIKKYGRVSDGGFIGRPITLEDILYLLEENFEDDKKGNTMPTSEIPEIKQLLDMWLFGQDFNNQQTKTINFLHDIICKNKT